MTGDRPTIDYFPLAAALARGERAPDRFRYVIKLTGGAYLGPEHASGVARYVSGAQDARAWRTMTGATLFAYGVLELSTTDFVIEVV